ncbi:MAG TPA: hypothetical protein VK171_06390 [Fimbriimonas sp.]|nr:hypothetical protein [Fimbriimonas sp.]
MAPSIHLKVEGDGFLRLVKGSRVFYARQAKLETNQQGLSTADGFTLVPRMVAPNGTNRLTVGLDGTLTAFTATQSKKLGRVVLAIFETTPKFEKAGNFVYTASVPTLTSPGEWIAGVIRTSDVKAPVGAPPKTTTTVASTGTAGQPFKAPSGSAPITAAKAEVVVNLKSEIDSERLTLGTFATVKGDSELVDKLNAVDFGRSPILGARRGLTTIHVKATIAAAGINVKNIKVVVPEGAAVERKCQKSDSIEILKAVTAAVKAKYGFEAQLEEKGRTTTCMIPVGKVTYDVAQVAMNQSDISATVNIAVDGKLANSLTLRFALPAMAMVQRGDTVRLRIKSNFAVVEVTGKTTSSAYLGQQVSVQSDNGATHLGTLIGPGLVEVKL